MLPVLASSTAGQVLLAVVFAWLGWWFWTFTIKPSFYPNEPKHYPYLIPYVGHAVAFSKDSDGVFTKARKYFGETREPFAITVAGQIFYVITSPEDTNLIYRNTKTLTFDEFIEDMVRTLGVSEKGIRSAFFPEAGSKPLPYYAQEIYKTQFLPGQRFYELWESIHPRLQQRMAFDSIPDNVVTKSQGDSKTVSLWLWVRSTLIESVTRSIFGDVMFELEPDLINVFAAFDDNSWKLFYKYPKYAAKDMHDALDRLRTMLVKYIDLPKEKRAGAAPIVRELESKFREFGIEGNDLALCLVMPIWATNSNAYKLCFWILALILQSSQLRDEIIEETRDAITSEANESGARLEQCRKLVAIYNEVLRVNTSSASIRGISTDTPIGSKILRAGNKVMVPYRQLHLNESVWGSDASTFNAKRFDTKQDLTRNPSWRPFGGGNTMCTGRHVAMREVLCFVATALHRLDVDVPEGTARSVDKIMAKVDPAMPTLGMLPPLPGQDVEVVIRRV